MHIHYFFWLLFIDYFHILIICYCLYYKMIIIIELIFIIIYDVYKFLFRTFL